MNFSIIFPTRERPSLLLDLLASIHQTTANPALIEVLVGYDDDDQSTIDLLPQLAFPWLKMLGRARGNNLSRDYHNWLYRQSTGRFIIVCNDDVIFRTQDWDTIALDRLNNYLADKPDGIVYGWLNDSLQNRAGGINYSCFPLVSRRAADTLGYVMHDFWGGWNADIHLYHLYSSVGRVCSISEVWLDHISHHTGKRERDATNLNMQRITTQGHVDTTLDRRKLLLAIKSRHPHVARSATPQPIRNALTSNPPKRHVMLRSDCKIHGKVIE